MGVLIDRLDGVVVHASAPGGGVHGEIRGRADIAVYFSSSFYGQVSESELERRLEQLARLLWAALAGRQKAIRAELGIHDIDDDPVRDRVFAQERDRITAAGRSDDGRVSVAVEGMRRWRFVLADDTVRILSERDFLAGLRAAINRLIEHQAQQIMQLKGRVYT